MTSDRTRAAEAALQAAGYPGVRVTAHDDVARLSVPAHDVTRFAAPEVREAVLAAVCGAGYRFVALDLDGG